MNVGTKRHKPQRGSISLLRAGPSHIFHIPLSTIRIIWLERVGERTCFIDYVHYMAYLLESCRYELTFPSVLFKPR